MMAADFVVYRVHIHRTKQEELYNLLESMPKSVRGLYIREALEFYRQRCVPALGVSKTPRISLQGAFDQDFGGKV
jgi:hypothetical protein